MSTLLLEPDYGSMGGAREDREELKDQNEELISLGVAWMRENPDVCRATEPTIAEAQMK